MSRYTDDLKTEEGIGAGIFSEKMAIDLSIDLQKGTH